MLYGWHLLPLHLCREHEEELSTNAPSGPAADYTQTPAFKHLVNNPNSRVVIQCQYQAFLLIDHFTNPTETVHGNAGHLGSEQRPDIYRMFLGVSTPENPVHVFALDYRGYGISTGFPTEEGLITDGMTLVNFLTSPPVSIPPSRIVITGQSLGTAVSTAVAERFMFGSPDSMAAQPAIKDSEPFAGIILLASFSNLPSLIESYSVKGLTPPMLSPLVGCPRLKSWLMSKIVDTWNTSARVRRLTGVGPTAEVDADAGYAGKELDLVIIHAFNDVEIPWYEGRRVATAATGEDLEQPDIPGEMVHKTAGENGVAQLEIWESKCAGPSKTAGKKKPVKKVRWERVGYGGMYLCEPVPSLLVQRFLPFFFFFFFFLD